jgi:hypothetical protein
MAMDEELSSRTERRRLTVGWLFAFGVAAVVATVAIAILAAEFFGDLDGTSTSVLKDEGNDIVNQLDKYKVTHGSYPPDLLLAGISPPTHPDGKWHFSPTPSLTGLGLLFWQAPDGFCVLSYDQSNGWKVWSRHTD